MGTAVASTPWAVTKEQMSLLEVLLTVDSFSGGDGNDTMTGGGTATDHFAGGFGDDIMTGGSGNDDFGEYYGGTDTSTR
jgi:Ca2+-binding RTX toxin-like protein